MEAILPLAWLPLQQLAAAKVAITALRLLAAVLVVVVEVQAAQLGLEHLVRATTAAQALHQATGRAVVEAVLVA